MSDAPSADHARTPSHRGGLVRRLVKDLPYYVLAQVVTSSLAIASIAVFTRLLDRKEYAPYALVVAGANLVGELAFGWLTQSALRFWHGHTANDEETRETFLSALLTLFGLASVASLVLWPLLAPVLFPTIGWQAAAIGLVLMIAQGGVRIAQTRRRIRRELKVYFWYATFPPLAGLVAGVILIKTSQVGAIGILMALTAATTTGVLIELILHRREYIPRKLRREPKQLRLLFEFGLPIAVGAIGGLALDVSDRFLLAHMFDVGVAAEYTVAYALAFKIDVVSAIVVTAAFPLLIQDYERKSAEAVCGDLSRLITAFSSIYAPAVCGLALIGRPLVQLLLGPDFQGAADYIAPLMPGVFMLGVERYISKVLQLAGDTRPRIVIISVSAAVNLLLNLLLLRRYGPVVAAWTTTAGYSIMVIIDYLWSRARFPFHLDWPALLRIGAATCGMALAVWASTMAISSPGLLLVTRIAVGVTSYAVLGWLLDAGGLRKQIVEHLRRRGA